ncbi:MAG: hypothetical protein NW241_21980 [Bacteroidia bacterium]|nr:hypothetical protein [Bacteroidia bacterium]
MAHQAPSLRTGSSFQQLSQAAEITRFRLEEKARHAARLKYHRDLKNVTDPSFMEGFVEGFVEGFMKGVMEAKTDMILRAHGTGLALEVISQIAGKSVEEIQAVLRKAGR